MEGGNVENIYHWGKSERGGSFFPQFVVIEWRDSSSQLSSKKINEKPYFNQKSLSHASSLTNWLSISSTFNEKLFCTKVFCVDFLYWQFVFVFFWQKDIGEKDVCAILVKLTILDLLLTSQKFFSGLKCWKHLLTMFWNWCDINF